MRNVLTGSHVGEHEAWKRHAASALFCDSLEFIISFKEIGSIMSKPIDLLLG